MVFVYEDKDGNSENDTQCILTPQHGKMLVAIKWGDYDGPSYTLDMARHHNELEQFAHDLLRELQQNALPIGYDRYNADPWYGTAEGEEVCY